MFSFIPSEKIRKTCIKRELSLRKVLFLKHIHLSKFLTHNKEKQQDTSTVWLLVKYFNKIHTAEVFDYLFSKSNRSEGTSSLQ